MKIFLIFFTSLLFSCGAKTSTRNESKSDSIAKQLEIALLKIHEFEKQSKKSDSTLNSKKETNINSIFNGLELSPIDPTKESSMTDANGNTTKFQNATVKTKKEIKTVYIKDTVSARKLTESESIINKYKDSLVYKNTEISMMKEMLEKSKVKEQFNWGTFLWQTWYWWLLLLLIIYLAYKWQKGTNPISLVSGIFSKIKLPIA